MRDFVKIIVIFVLLGLLALSINSCISPIVDKMKAAYKERQQLPELQLEFRRHSTICKLPKIGEAQAHIDCVVRSKKLFRKDI